MTVNKQSKPPKELAFGHYSESEKNPQKKSAFFPNFRRMVKALLAEKGKTMSDLAEYLDMSRQGLYGHINSPNPNMFIIRLIAEYLDESVTNVLGNPDFDEPKNVYTFPEFYNLKNRVKLHALKNGLNFKNIADVLTKEYKNKITSKELESILEEYETYDLNNDSENFISAIVLLSNVLKVIGVDFYNFFFLNSEKVDERIKKAIGVIKAQETIAEDMSINISWLLNSTNNEISSRVEVMSEMIDYYVKKYPNDKVSRLLTTLNSYDVIAKKSKKHAALKKAIKSEMKSID